MPVGAAAAAGIGIGMQALGMGMQTAQDNARSYKQYYYSNKLAKQSQARNKDMAMFNADLQRQLWEDTGYVAQKDQIKRAGLNPALMYGMSGGGGQTAQAIGGAPASSGGAGMTSGGGMGIEMAGIIGSLRKQQAEVDLLESQASNLDANTAKTTGVDTDVAKANLEKIGAETGNVQADTIFTQMKTQLEGLNVELKGRTMEDAVRMAGSVAEQAGQEVDKMVRENMIGDKTALDRIKLIQIQVGQAIATKSLTDANINKTEAEINKMAADITNEVTRLGILQGELTERQRNNAYYNAINNVKDSTKLTAETATKVVGDIIEAATKIKTATKGPKNKETHTYKEEGYEHKVETYK